MSPAQAHCQWPIGLGYRRRLAGLSHRRTGRIMIRSTAVPVGSTHAVPSRKSPAAPAAHSGRIDLGGDKPGSSPERPAPCGSRHDPRRAVQRWGTPDPSAASHRPFRPAPERSVMRPEGAVPQDGGIPWRGAKLAAAGIAVSSQGRPAMTPRWHPDEGGQLRFAMPLKKNRWGPAGSTGAQGEPAGGGRRSDGCADPKIVAGSLRLVGGPGGAAA
jgi:hypothetical protein